MASRRLYKKTHFRHGARPDPRQAPAGPKFLHHDFVCLRAHAAHLPPSQCCGDRCSSSQPARPSIKRHGVGIQRIPWRYQRLAVHGHGTWAMVRFAEAAPRFVALHVLISALTREVWRANWSIQLSTRSEFFTSTISTTHVRCSFSLRRLPIQFGCFVIADLAHIQCSKPPCQIQHCGLGRR